VSAAPHLIEARGRPERDLIERIASALPEEVRADYFREMSHCRVLPESDEMLRILRAMQFLALLIQRAPGEVAAEREKLAQLMEKSVNTIQSAQQLSVNYQKELEDRIAELPDEIGKGIDPEVIAERISHDVRKRFAGIPETVQALSSVSNQMTQVVAEFHRTAGQLTNSYHGVAASARHELDEMRAGIQQASAAATAAQQRLSKTVASTYRWAMAALCGAALLVGLALGITFHELTNPPAQIAPATVQAAEPAEPAPATRPGGKKRAQPAANDLHSRMGRQYEAR